jgi:hypothetical protein
MAALVVRFVVCFLVVEVGSVFEECGNWWIGERGMRRSVIRND